MKIVVETLDAYDKRYETIDALIDEYRAEELQAGRELPRFAWEALALAAVGWLIGKVADRLFDEVASYRVRRSERQRQAESQALQKHRHEELMRKLDKLAAEPEDVTELDRLRRAIATGQVRVEVVLETRSEADLQLALEKLIPGARIKLSQLAEKGS